MLVGVCASFKHWQIFVAMIGGEEPAQVDDNASVGSKNKEGNSGKRPEAQRRKSCADVSSSNEVSRGSKPGMRKALQGQGWRHAQNGDGPQPCLQDFLGQG